MRSSASAQDARTRLCLLQDRGSTATQARVSETVSRGCGQSCLGSGRAQEAIKRARHTKSNGCERSRLTHHLLLSVSKRSAEALARPWRKWRRTLVGMKDRCGTICEEVEIFKERAAELLCAGKWRAAAIARRDSGTARLKPKVEWVTAPAHVCQSVYDTQSFAPLRRGAYSENARECVGRRSRSPPERAGSPGRSAPLCRRKDAWDLRPPSVLVPKQSRTLPRTARLASKASVDWDKGRFPWHCQSLVRITCCSQEPCPRSCPFAPPDVGQ